MLDNVCEGSEMITIGDKTKHGISYLEDFLFAPARARTPVKALSGGERNRVLLARLFTKSFNVLVLDEPTNDLDIETLELLEEQLINFTGTLLLVSHDREFLNNVVTSTLVMESNGHVGEYVGGYDDWIRVRSQHTKTAEKQPKSLPPNKLQKSTAAPQKLSYKEKRELDALPKRIELLEKEQQLLQKQLSSPNFYKEHADQVVGINQRLSAINNELELAFLRW